MGGWEEELLEQLRREDAARSGQAHTGLGANRLQEAFDALCARFQTSVDQIAEGLGIQVERRGDSADGRVRWQHALRSLSAWLDTVAGTIFVNADLGDHLEIEELTLGPSGQPLDREQQPVDLDALARRFVTLLFRGKAG